MLPTVPEDMNDHFAKESSFDGTEAMVISARSLGLFQDSGRIEDLDQAIALARVALALRPSGHPDRADALVNIAGALLERFGLFRNSEDLDDAALFFREALGSQNLPNHAALPALNKLSAAVLLQFEERGQLKDLEEGVALLWKLFDLCPPEHPSLPFYSSNLISALDKRFQELGNFEDLEEAITYTRVVLEHTVPDDPIHRDLLYTLGNRLAARFHHVGRLADLNDAIEHLRAALVHRPSGSKERSEVLLNLGSALSRRARVLRNLDDLHDAAARHQEAISFGAVQQPEHHLHLYNLAGTYQFMYTQGLGIIYLEKSTNLLREALGLLPPEHHNRVVILGALGTNLQLHFLQSDKPEDLAEAIEHLHSAMASLPPEHPGLSVVQRSLARSHMLNDNFEPAFSLFKQAAEQTTASTKDRLDAAHMWAWSARHAVHPSGLRAYAHALALLDQCMTVAPTMELQHQFLVSRSGLGQGPLASDSASLAIDEGKLEIAVEMLEQGRALLWSRMRGYRHPLEKLRSADARLAEDFERISRDRERLAASSDLSRPSDALRESSSRSFDDKMTRNRELSEAWEDMLTRIRALGGDFTTFLQATPYHILQTAASQGPVLIVNISGFRSDVVILRENHAPHLVQLGTGPKLFETVHALSLKVSHVDATRTRDRSGDRASRPDRSEPENTMASVLRALWLSVCKPVAGALFAMGIVRGSRVWWCPTGKLTALPLHAAGPYTDDQEGFHDLFVSSYIPTLSSLIAARAADSAAPRSAGIRLLGVGQSQTLPFVKEEFEIIKEKLLGCAEIRDREEATPDLVLEALQHHTWAHFACHGSLSASEPFESGFVLHAEQTLSLRHIMQARLPRAELAFLAACHSAASDAQTPEEALSLAAAVQFCGFRAAVGTLWTMADRDGPALAEAFYAYMTRRGAENADVRDAALAVHVAAKSLRDQGLPFHRWTSFIHLGI